jgi:uncharacterized protein (TIGR03086 family)
MMSAVELHGQAARQFRDVIASVRDDQWALPTPCDEWDVKALINHVVGEALWTPPLLSGLRIADVGNSLDGDLLGPDPRGAWNAAYAATIQAADDDGVADRIVHLSFGDTPAAEYLRQLAADYLVHAWDLAVAVGADSTLDPAVVSAVAGWFEGVEFHYRAAGIIGPQVGVEHGSDSQSHLLARFGRDASRYATKS